MAHECGTLAIARAGPMSEKLGRRGGDVGSRTHGEKRREPRLIPSHAHAAGSVAPESGRIGRAASARRSSSSFSARVNRT